MKETKTSLKWYFIVIGVLGLWSLMEISTIKVDTFGGIWLIVNAIFGGIFLYIGIKLEEILSKFSKKIINFLLIDLGFISIGALYYISKGSLVGVRAISLIVSIAVTMYLIKNVKRLSNASHA